MRARAFVAVFAAGCATSPFPEDLARSADRALTLRELRSDSTNGRFLVRTPEFLDPAIYAPGRRLTVLGTVAGRSERRVGDLPYVYPVISAERIKLWPKETPWVGGEYPPLPLDSPVLPPVR